MIYELTVARVLYTMAHRNSDASAGTTTKSKKAVFNRLRALEEMFGTALPQHQSPLFKVPGELRNRIYYYALDMHQPYIFDWEATSDIKSKRHVTSASKTTRQDTPSLLFSCKQVCLKANSLLEEPATAVLPLRDLQRLHPISRRALTTFMSLTLELPTENQRQKRNGKVDFSDYWLELLETLGTFISASPLLCADRQRRRTATVVFRPCWPRRDHFSHCLMEMARDDFTDWEVHATSLSEMASI
jgi:hypothetical protein